MQRCILAILSLAFCAGAQAVSEDVQLNLVTPQGVGQSIGSVKITETDRGLEFAPELRALPPGKHGFHIHAEGSCQPAMKEGKAVIALAGNEFAGFSYIESWGNKQYVTTSGLIVHPNFRGLGIAKRIKDMTFQLARMRWPKAKIFSLTSGAAVMKMNTELGYVPVTFSDLTDDEAFWRGCNGCVNHDILERTERKYCICTAMLFDPADPHRAQREREARNQTKKD